MVVLGEVLVPRVWVPPGVDEVEPGGLRVVPEGGNGPALPPELVVADPGEVPEVVGVSKVVLLEDPVVPPTSGGLGDSGGGMDRTWVCLCPQIRLF